MALVTADQRRMIVAERKRSFAAQPHPDAPPESFASSIWPARLRQPCWASHSRRAARMLSQTAGALLRRREGPASGETPQLSWRVTGLLEFWCRQAGDIHSSHTAGPKAACLHRKSISEPALCVYSNARKRAQEG